MGVKKPKHEYQRILGTNDVECWACTVMYGESTYPCTRDYGKLTHEQQRAFYERTGACGKCGQRAGTWRQLCRCKNCGCFESHNAMKGIERQGGLFDEVAPQEPRRTRGKEPENPG